MAFLPRDGFKALAEIAVRTRLHFDEHDHVPISGDNIELATTGAEAWIENRITPPAQLLARQIFAEIAEGSALVLGHDGAQCKAQAGLVNLLSLPPSALR